jgi:phosphoribosylformimino-5-aminoimidazole carboxamide ribonucleotide (ProFAR) isomerase
VKIENIEKVATIYREYQHLLQVSGDIKGAAKVTLQITVTNNVIGSSALKNQKIVDVPISACELLSVIDKAIDHKRVALLTFGVEGIELDSQKSPDLFPGVWQ